MTSLTARRVLAHWADLRPSWVWSADGVTLLWRNGAARHFADRQAPSGEHMDFQPIRGQVARILRMSAPGRSSPSRVQFLLGARPISLTCVCTPLGWTDGDLALLMVGTDEERATLPQLLAEPDPLSLTLLPRGSAYVVQSGGEAIASSPGFAETEYANNDALVRFGNDPGLIVHLLEDPEEDGLDNDLSSAEQLTAAPVASEELVDLEPAPERSPSGEAEVDVPPFPLGDDVQTEDETSLSSLFDRLSNTPDLFVGLPPRAVDFGELAPIEASDTPAGAFDEDAMPANDAIAELIALNGEEAEPDGLEIAENTESALPGAPPGDVIDVFDDVSTPVPVAEDVAEPAGIEVSRVADPEIPTDTGVPRPEDLEAPVPGITAIDDETAERVSRYNFEELGRILTDRVSEKPKYRGGEAAARALLPAPAEAVITLGAETLVLNRLPLAVLVFRDQQVLFANRALIDLLGFGSVETLRESGMASIFPGDEGGSAGTVDRLVRRDGMAIPVAARLQSVTWQGRPALMLSASTAEPVRTHEASVRTFAAAAALATGDGFLAANRTGRVIEITAAGQALFDDPTVSLEGKPLDALLAAGALEPLRQFLERPARFAETARPSATFQIAGREADLILFAEGQAGIVTGYFGFLRRRVMGTAVASLPTFSTGELTLDAGLLGRISRGIRRPLNTIIGFADLMRSAAFGGLANDRYSGYARDIRTAGLEIAVLVDELDEYARLDGGEYKARPSELSLADLLESSVFRVRAMAKTNRVLVRTAVSAVLPRIRADRSSLGQALLNLLASAIDQTPVGGSVIVSAQRENDGIFIHVRDGAQITADLGDRFVVFRDGVDESGSELEPVRSSVGLAMTRSLLQVNDCSLSVDPTAGAGTLFTIHIPFELVVGA